MFRMLLAVIGAALLAGGAQAQAPGPQLQARIGEVVTILRGDGDPAAVFAPAFLTEVPPAQLRTVAASLIAQNRALTGVKSIAGASPWDATVELDYESAVVTMRIVIEPAPPHRVTGLLVTGVAARDDSFAKLTAEFADLPGKSAFAVTPLGGDAPLAWHNPDTRMAIGSGFKLYILGALAEQVAKRKRRWSDVTTLGAASLPSGIVQGWPKAAPVTLHTLATLMISISDNSATDTLLDVAGREAVGDYLRATGHAAPDATLPILRTAEFFALKAPANADLAARWRSSPPAARMRLLADESARLTADKADVTAFGGKPNLIDSIEWFASPGDLARLLDRLRRSGDAEALAILAVNPGLAGAEAARWDYVGFKGGSESGVVALNYLLRDKAGRWFAVTGAWNDPAATVDTPRFAALMARAIALIPR